MKRTSNSTSPSPHTTGLRAAKLGMVLAVAALLWPITSRAQSVGYTVLRDFQGAVGVDGAFLYSGLVLAGDGRLYGTTWGGGSGAGGTVFGINTDGSGYTTLRNFTREPDACLPYSSLVQGFDGALYGTTYSGGTSNAGTVFKIHTDGSGFQILRSFNGPPDAGYPWAGLVQGRDGWLYGTTTGGGIADQGTVFRIGTNGAGYQILHSFLQDFVDGAAPYAALIQGQDGAFYGVTDVGGSTLLGTVFRISPDGSSYQVLYTFQSGTGFWPRGALMQGNDALLYGTTTAGGPNNGGGVVYRLRTNGLGYAVLHTFPGSPDCWANLVQTGDGALYGTARWGGDTNGGFVFRLRPDGSEYSVVHHFSFAGPDGSRPSAGLIQSDDVLYGTTMSGGLWDMGTVYRLTIALPPALSISLSAQGPRITFTGLSGQRCRLDATTNCADWHPRANLVLTNGTAEFVETDAVGVPARLYRAVAQ